MRRERPRALRVASELKRVVNDLLREQIKDPRLEGVRVSDVEVSGDLGVAKLFYSTLDPDQDCAPIEEALAKASGFLRSRLGHEIRLRHVPELRFIHDTSARTGFELSRLLAENAPKTPPDPADES